MKNENLLKMLVNVPIVLDRAVPYLISGAIVFSGFKALNHTPFIIDTEEEKTKIQIIDTSTGIHSVTELYNGIDEHKIEYSEKWKKNEYGLYERKKTIFIFDNKNYNERELLSMSKEELEKIFVVQDVEYVAREKLEASDLFYDENMVIITRTIDGKTYNLKEESLEENIVETINYIVATVFMGMCLEQVKTYVSHDGCMKELISYRDDEKVKKYRR